MAKISKYMYICNSNKNILNNKIKSKVICEPDV